MPSSFVAILTTIQPVGSVRLKAFSGGAARFACCAAEGERRAVVLVGSQKTLPIAVTVLGQLGGALPDLAVGLAVIPCVVAHLAQILVDSLLVSHWLRQDARRVPRAA